MSTTGLSSNTYMHSIAWAGQRPCAAMPSERRLGCQCSLGWYLPCFPLNSKLEFWVTFTQKLELQRAEKRFGADISLAIFSIQNLSKFHSQTSGSWKQTRVGYFAQTQGTSEGDGWDGQGNQNGWMDEMKKMWKDCNFVYCEDSQVRSIVRWQKAGRAKKVQVKISSVKVVPR